MFSLIVGAFWMVYTKLKWVRFLGKLSDWENRPQSLVVVSLAASIGMKEGQLVPGVRDPRLSRISPQQRGLRCLESSDRA